MALTLKKALFLDRDGVVNVEKEYLYKINDFEFIEGIFELCRYYQNLGYIIFVITNQSGIGRGFYGESDFVILTSWMVQEFAKNGVDVQKVYYCPHHPEFSGDCSCRKPHAGMLLNAQKEFAVDLENSILVGDKETDIEAGLNAGLHETYFFDQLNKITNSKATKIVHKLDDIWKKRC